MAEELQTYETVYVLTAFNCLSCRQAIQPQVENLPIMATAIHAQTGIICPDPKFIIGFLTQLVDSRLIGQPVIEAQASESTKTIL